MSDIENIVVTIVSGVIAALLLGFIFGCWDIAFGACMISSVAMLICDKLG